MPPKANKIATAMAAANRAVVKNYNAANRAINRAPAWVKWTIAAIAVAIIGYALWKVFFAGKKEGFETDSNKFEWDSSRDGKTVNDLTKYNILNYKDGEVSHSPFDQESGTVHVNEVIQLEDNLKLPNAVFYAGDEGMTMDEAKYWCGRSKFCNGIHAEKRGNDRYNIRYLGKIKFDDKDLVEDSKYMIVLKNPKTVVGDPGNASLKPPNITWGDAFKSLETDTNYMVYWRDTQVSGTNNNITTTKNDQEGTADAAIDALKTAKDGSNILVFNGNNKYWLRKADTKDSFRGAVITPMWTSESPLADQFVTVIKKGNALTFANFGELETKTKESPGAVAGGGSDGTGGGTQGTRTEFDKAKDHFINNKTYFESDPLNSANYILSTKDVRFATSVPANKPYEENPKSFELCFTAFKQSGSSVMVYRSDGHCWFKTPINKEDFAGANLVEPKIGDEHLYTTVIRKSLGFSTELDVINKAKEKPAMPESSLLTLAGGDGIHVHLPKISVTQRINTTPITLKECVTQGYSKIPSSQGIIAHDAGERVDGDETAYNCWWVDFRNKNSLEEAIVNASETSKVRIYTDRNPNADLSSASAFNTWVGKQKPIELGTDEFYIKKDGKYLYAKNDFANKFAFTDDGNKNIFKFRNNVFSSNLETLGLRADASNSNQYVLVWGKEDNSNSNKKSGWTVYSQARFEPAGGVDQYKIFMTDDGVTKIPLFTSLTSDPYEIISAKQDVNPQVFTLEKK